MCPRSLRFQLFVALAMTSATATAQTMAPVVIQTPAPPQGDASDNFLALRNGEHIRGHIIDLHPNQYLIITLPEGNRTVPWSEIMHAEGPTFPGGYTANVYAAPVAIPPAIAPTDYLHPEAGRVPLIVESGGPPMMIGESFTAGVGNGFGGLSAPQGRALCMTPCTLYVWPSAFTLQSQARGIRPNVVGIAIPRSGIRVRLRAASRSAFYGAVASLIGGGLVMVTGVGLIVQGSIFESWRASGAFTHIPDPSAYYVAGSVALGIGAAAMVIGAIIMAGNRTGLESSTPLTSPVGPQISFGPTADGFAGSMALHF